MFLLEHWVKGVGGVNWITHNHQPTENYQPNLHFLQLIVSGSTLNFDLLVGSRCFHQRCLQLQQEAVYQKLH